MSRVKVQNTCIIVEDYKLGENSGLENPFKKFNAITHKFEYFGIYYDKENKRLYMPGGIDVWWVRKQLNEKYYDRIVPDIQIQNTKPMKMKYTPRDEKQMEALKFLNGLGPYEDNKYLPALSLNLNVGMGKTYTVTSTIAFRQQKTIVITGSNSLLAQWKSELLRYTNLEDSDVFNISGSDQCNMIINGSSGKAKNASVYLCSHGTLRSFCERYGWDKLQELLRILGIGLKVYDEAHTNYQNMLMIDFFSNVEKTFYVTATLARSDYREDKIFQVSLKNVPYINLFDEETDTRTKYIAIKWNSRPSPLIISEFSKNPYGFDRIKYMEWLTKNPEFYKMLNVIVDMIYPIIKRRQPVLMYIGTNDSVLRVYHWIATNYPNLVGDIGIFTSLVSKEQKLKEKKKLLLLSSTKSAGIGEHIEGLKVTIVLDEPFKSSVLARQTLGRTRDKDTTYIELVDMGFRALMKFYFAKQNVFKKYATSISDSTIDSYELDRRCAIIAEERDTWRRCPIALSDDRFDFNSVLPDSFKNNDNKNTIRCPVSFHKKDNTNKRFK